MFIEPPSELLGFQTVEPVKGWFMGDMAICYIVSRANELDLNKEATGGITQREDAAESSFNSDSERNGFTVKRSKMKWVYKCIWTAL
jgi:hypothetical protein